MRLSSSSICLWFDTRRCILSTDMAKHNDILKAFRALIPTFDITAKDQKELVSHPLLFTFVRLCESFLTLYIC